MSESVAMTLSSVEPSLYQAAPLRHLPLEGLQALLGLVQRHHDVPHRAMRVERHGFQCSGQQLVRSVKHDVCATVERLCRWCGKMRKTSKCWLLGDKRKYCETYSSRRVLEKNPTRLLRSPVCCCITNGTSEQPFLIPRRSTRSAMAASCSSAVLSSAANVQLSNSFASRIQVEADHQYRRVSASTGSAYLPFSSCATTARSSHRRSCSPPPLTVR